MQVARRIVLAMLFFVLALLMASTASAQGTACYYITPIRDQYNHVIDCACRLHLEAGHCECVRYKQNLCGVDVNCPSDCVGGASIEKLAKIKATVSAAPTIVTVYMKQSCYDNNAKLWMDEVVRQGKAIRFAISPDRMSNAQVDDWNKRIEKVERAIREQEQ